VSIEVDGIDLDLMALADLGQPRRLALEIHRQLRERFTTVPLPVPLEQIATAVGIVGIREFDTDAFEGTLVIANGDGAIGLRAGMRSGRKNFTLGHEPGHFVIPSHRLTKTRFECSAADMRRFPTAGENPDSHPVLERIEIEANEFSAELIVPMPEFRGRRRKLGKGVDLAHVRVLARDFDVSLEVMSKVYVRDVGEPAVVILAKNGVVRRVIPGPEFPYMGLRAGRPLPDDCFTRRWLRSAEVGQISDLRDVPPHHWIERSTGIPALYEQVLAQIDGWSSTLLTVETTEEDEEADDSHWNRR
jgi:Zn-dependent peptidase ImmA (M78 family)